MFYKVEVFDDGDIFITKTEDEKNKNEHLYFNNIRSLRNELIDYGINEVADDICRIRDAETNEPVQCY